MCVEAEISGDNVPHICPSGGDDAFITFDVERLREERSPFISCLDLCAKVHD